MTFLVACDTNVPSLGAATAALNTLDSGRLEFVQPDEQVLATVNGSRIGEEDLAINMARTLGDSYAQLMDSDVENKVLESMIASRAIALRSLDEMEDFDKVSLEKRVMQFREELLVKAYLLDHAEPDVVSQENIRTYYENNPEEFAGQKERLYEIVTVSRADYQRNSQAALQAVSLAKTYDDWQQLARDSLADDSLVTVAHSFQTQVGKNAKSAIDKVVIEMSEGEMSKVLIDNGAPYLIRLREVTQTQPIPIEQARADIKRKLLPASIRKSVKSVSNTVLETTDVVLTSTVP